MRVDLVSKTRIASKAVTFESAVSIASFHKISVEMKSPD
jgi:hypothetical protein